jgi:hypothetical protein
MLLPETTLETFPAPEKLFRALSKTFLDCPCDTTGKAKSPVGLTTSGK